jgi:hypothetical protein
MIGGGSSPGWHGIRRVSGKEDSPLTPVGFAENLKPDNESPGLVIRTLAGTIVFTVTDK